MRKTCWILCDRGKIGTLRQCEALAESLNLAPIVYEIDLTGLGKFIPPSWARFLPSPNPNITQHPLPHLVIAAGRRSVPLALYLSKKTNVIFIQNPKVDPSSFVAVIAPEHDQLTGKNVIVTKGSLHKITPQFLTEQKSFAPTKHPVMAVFIGGDSKHFKYTDQTVDTLCDHLLRFLSETGGSLLITASRRTRPEHVARIRAALKNANTTLWDGTGENPYFSYMASADIVCVTSDSMSMMSECCSSGKPVYLFMVPIKHPKFEHFTENLITNGYAKILEDDSDFSFDTPLNVLDDMAAVMEKLPALLPAL